jgi:predicted ATP-dependent protease
MEDRSDSHLETLDTPVTAQGRAKALPWTSLYKASDLSGLAFETTDDLAPVMDGFVGQHRALDAVNLGMHIQEPGFNLFAIGAPGLRMEDSVRALLEISQSGRPGPSDWVYINNFSDHHRPMAVALPAGRAPKFREAMNALITDLRTALPAVFQSQDYQTRRGALDEMFSKKQAEGFAAVRDNAAKKSIIIVRTPAGFALAPLRNGQVVSPEEFHSWPEDKRNEVRASIQELEKELEKFARQVPQWEKERRDEVLRLDREVAKIAVEHLIDETKTGLSDLAKVLEYLGAVRGDIVENVALFLMKNGEDEEPAQALPENVFDRYRVNVLVTQASASPSAPIVEELHPTLNNLIGRIEHVVRDGVLVTNFLLIKAGALHRANGRYLLLDARNLLSEPFSWSALKRALKKREVAIEDVAHFMGLTSTVSLEPGPIPLRAKVVIFGDRLLYFLLMAFDPETAEHFKLLADFENEVDRSTEQEMLLARLLASLAKRSGLRPLRRDAVALTIEYAARVAGDSQKLTLLAAQLMDVLSEANFYAGDAKHPAILSEDIERAIAQRVYRTARIRDRLQEAVQRNIVLIDTKDTQTGQVNGLSVYELAGVTFGSAARITCRVRPGAGKVVDIEREVELGGPVHSKGVLILSGFLAGRYALETPMSLYASLVFEQSYGGVEGDSASSAELYALISALANVPLRQDLAVTGSVNQHGEIQAVGGINEKIEGFFDICAARGLTRTQGVIVPQANVQHLMLRRDVVAACADGRFAVYPVATIDEGISLLTGQAAGERGADGLYPDNSINRLIEDRLRGFAASLRQFATVAPATIAGKEHA